MRSPPGTRHCTPVGVESPAIYDLIGRSEAESLNSGDSDTSLEEIEGDLGQDGERRVDLQGTVPIYIVYLTAWVEEDGTTRFHHDPYHRDRRIRAMVPG